MPSSSASAVRCDNVGTGGGAPEQSASCIVAKSTAAGSHTLTIDGFSQIKARTDFQNPIKSGTFTAGGHICNGEKVSTAFKFTLLDHNGRPSDSMSVGIVWTYTESCSSAAAALVETKSLESRKATYLHGDCLRVRCDVTVYKEPRCEDRDVPSRLIHVPPPDIGEQLGRLLSSGVGADLRFEIDGVTFAVHRHILNVRSPVLLEEISGATTCKHISGVQARVLKALIHYIYTDSLPEIDDGEAKDMAWHLIAAANRYGLDRLKLISENILCRRVDTNTVAAMLAHAEEYKCHGLKKACVQFLMSGRNLKAAIAAGGFEQLRSSCPSVLKELLAIMADRR